MRRIFKQTTTAALILSALLAAMATASAQHGHRVTRRIQLRRGRTTAAVKGAIPNRLEAHEYLLRAQAGQTMNVHLASATRNVEFLILRPNEEVMEGANAIRDWSGGLAESGDYHINVYTTGKAARYTLEVAIR